MSDKFRARIPHSSIWNAKIHEGKQSAAWKEAINFVLAIKSENVDGFYIQVNKKRAPRN